MDLKAVGQRIQNARKKCGLTQEQLAERVNLSAPHIGVIERGGAPPKITNFVAIANALGVSADELLGDVLEHTENTECKLIYEEIKELSPNHRAVVLRVMQTVINELKTEQY